ncbi:hypothetical protein H0H81_012459 [Sphagnurus paluster]|uniref:Cytochrome b561 domain-containing protein n=1 Tax=Sphagnurus paluster TaxID=117069 RepID=A0A9P7GGT5_9AGAR|nr:hypothetical protein H0H81_012459 [Sphagnurus paluster]
MQPNEPALSDNGYELLPGHHRGLMGQNEQLLKPEARRGDELAQYTALFSVTVLGVVTWLVVLSNNPTNAGWFALHPTLQTLSLVAFTYGILTLQPTSQPKTKLTGLARHQVVVLLIGFPGVLLGTCAIAYNKWLSGKEHMTTWHGHYGFRNA